MSQTTYSSQVYFPAWTVNNGATLTPVADTRDADFGTLLLAQFKQYARITYTNDDNILPSFINQAIETLEQSLEFCILPRSFDWDVGPNNVDFERYEVPLRNTTTVGYAYDFTNVRAMNLIDPPTAWPVTLVCGYDDETLIPSDLLNCILSLATALEQNRGAIEASAIPLPTSLAAKYMVMRC